MGCCNSANSSQRRQNNGPIDYEQCLQTLASQTDAAGFFNVLCKAAAPASGCCGNQSEEADTGGAQCTGQSGPGFQCVIVPVRSLCQEFSIFHLDVNIFKRVILCTFSNIFSRLNPELCHQVYSQYETFLSADPAINFAAFCKLFAANLHQLYSTYRAFPGNACDFYSFLTSPLELTQLTDCTPDNLAGNQELIVSYIAKQKFLEELSEEYTKMEYAICQRVLRMEIDLVILATRITELATNTNGGISGITEALGRVAIGEGNRYFEEDDFKDLFHAAKEVAEVIQKLSRIYRKRFKLFAELSTKYICSRPQPPVKTIIREIPTLPPTVII